MRPIEREHDDTIEEEAPSLRVYMAITDDAWRASDADARAGSTLEQVRNEQRACCGRAIGEQRILAAREITKDAWRSRVLRNRRRCLVHRWLDILDEVPRLFDISGEVAPSCCTRRLAARYCDRTLSGPLWN